MNIHAARLIRTRDNGQPPAEHAQDNIKREDNPSFAQALALQQLMYPAQIQFQDIPPQAGISLLDPPSTPPAHTASDPAEPLPVQQPYTAWNTLRVATSSIDAAPSAISPFSPEPVITHDNARQPGPTPPSPRPHDASDISALPAPQREKQNEPQLPAIRNTAIHLLRSNPTPVGKNVEPPMLLAPPVQPVSGDAIEDMPHPFQETFPVVSATVDTAEVPINEDQPKPTLSARVDIPSSGETSIWSSAPPATGSTFANAVSGGSVSIASMQPINIPLNHPEWPAALSARFLHIVRNTDQGSHTAELRIHPSELGPLRIAVSVTDNVAQAAFFSPHAAVRHALDQALPQLQLLMAQAGISLGQASVNDQQHTGQLFGQQEDRSGPDPGPDEQAAADPRAHPSSRQDAQDGLIDIYV